MTATSWWQDAFNYGVDSAQRSILFWDVMRKRGNSFFDHLRAGQPPVLTFDYEIIMDGRAFEQPVNYALARIIDRRAKERSPGINEAVVESKPAGKYAVPKRPIVVIDPRAGHGPGIGGSKRDSEVGVALDNGHPVYFILFFTQPEPGQTLAGVEYAETRFIEEVVLRHPDADRPALIGNCQGGTSCAGQDQKSPCSRRVIGVLCITGKKWLNCIVEISFTMLFHAWPAAMFQWPTIFLAMWRNIWPRIISVTSGDMK